MSDKWRQKQLRISELRAAIAEKEAELAAVLLGEGEDGGDTPAPGDHGDQGEGEGGLPPLTNSDIARYSRQMILPELRPEGQRRLLASSALIVGCGGECRQFIILPYLN